MDSSADLHCADFDSVTASLLEKVKTDSYPMNSSALI
jgi:hypothetical protein